MTRINNSLARIATAPLFGLTVFFNLTASIIQAARDCGDIEQRVESYKDRI